MTELYTRVKIYNRRLLTWRDPEFVVVDQLNAVPTGTVGGQHDNNASRNMLWDVTYEAFPPNTAVIFRNAVTGYRIAPGKNGTLVGSPDFPTWSFKEIEPGLYRITDPHSGKAWSLLDSHDSTPITLQPSNEGDDRQEWFIVPYIQE